MVSMLACPEFRKMGVGVVPLKVAVPVGTLPGDQFVGVFQSLNDAPVQVASCANAVEKVEPMPMSSAAAPSARESRHLPDRNGAVNGAGIAARRRLLPTGFLSATIPNRPIPQTSGASRRRNEYFSTSMAALFPDRNLPFTAGLKKLQR